MWSSPRCPRRPPPPSPAYSPGTGAPPHCDARSAAALALQPSGVRPALRASCRVPLAVEALDSSAVRSNKCCAADMAFSHGVLWSALGPGDIEEAGRDVLPVGAPQPWHPQAGAHPPPPILLPLSSPVLACRISAWGVREREARVGTWSAETKGECVSKRRAGTGHEKSSRGTFLRLCTAHPILSDSSPPVSTTLKHAGTICGTSPGTSAGRPLRAGNLCTTAQLPAWLGGAGQPAGGQQHQGP